MTEDACYVPNCDRPVWVASRGLCNKHYQRFMKYGNPTAGSTEKGAPQKFYKDVVLLHDADECLIWPYGSGQSGDARLWSRGQMRPVQGLVCRHVNGPPPTPKHESAHSCGKGHEGCVAPRHLSWKTHTENMADTLLHGTRIRGVRSYNAKLNESDVHNIRRARGVTLQQTLVEQYGVCQQTISDIQRGRRWGWLQESRA